MSDDDKFNNEYVGNAVINTERDQSVDEAGTNQVLASPSLVEILKKFEYSVLSQYNLADTTAVQAESEPHPDVLEGCGELSKCMFHVRKCGKQDIELRMILPELNRSTY